MKPAIYQVIAQVLKSRGEPMSPRQIYDAISASSLYQFKAQDPLSVVKTQLRRHCEGLNFPSARSTKYFAQAPEGKYRLLDKPVRVPGSLYPVTSEGSERTPAVLVSVPNNDEEAAAPADGPSHSEIQWRLLDLGCQLGLSVWAPIPDRGKDWCGHRIGSVASMLAKIPQQFPPAVIKTIEYIDVLWLDGNEGIVAGFEVEHTSTIYSGLLRMSDLLTMQPNIDIKLYLVAPDERADKFAREVARPTFAQRKKPLHSICRFLPYSNLLDKLEETKNVIRHLRPEFLDDIAEAYSPVASS